MAFYTVEDKKCKRKFDTKRSKSMASNESVQLGFLHKNLCKKTSTRENLLGERKYGDLHHVKVISMG